MASNDISRYGDFDALVARHQGLICSLCWWHASGDGERTADLMQEVLAQLWHARHTLRPGATPAQERAWVRVRYPQFEMVYEPEPIKQAIADSWPDKMDDSCARKEWGWNPQYDLERMTDDMILNLKKKLL